MLITRAEVDAGYLLPLTLAADIQRLFDNRAPNDLQLVVRALFNYLQDRTDQWFQAGAGQSRPARDTGDAGDADARAAAGNTGDTGDADAQAAGAAYAHALTLKAYAALLAGDAPADEPDAIDDATLFRLYQARFDFTASDLLEDMRAVLDLIGRADLVSLLTPTVIGHRLRALGLPYHRTNQRRCYTLSYPLFIPLIKQHGSLLPVFPNYPADYFRL